MARQYKSKLRAERAEQTKRAIVEAAFELFLENGYVETSMRAIAGKAGVSERTVYAVFKDKTSILMAIGHHAFYGNADPDEAVAKYVDTLARTPDPMERLRASIHQSALGMEQGLAALARVVMVAAQSDSRLEQWLTDMIDLRHRTYWTEVEAIVGRELSGHLEYEPMIDELEAIGSEQVYWILTAERGWPRERYEQWLVDLCVVTMQRYGIELASPDGSG